jgi:hypothetical protein
MHPVRSLFVACFLPLAARGDDMAVVFNEINYHPAGSNSEWVELHNLHGVNVDLSGWNISGGINYTFAEGTVINGRDYLVLAAVPAGVPGAIGPWTGGLSNAGETIRLRNRDGRIMAEVNYADNGDWPVGPDGTGTTLARRKPGAHSGPAAWTTSSEPGGTPGAANFSYAGSPPKVTTPVTIGATGWKYLTPGAAAPAGWQTTAFSDAGWSEGQAAFYSGNAQIAEPTPAQVTLSDPGVGLYGWWNFDDNLNNSVAGGTNGVAVGADFAYVTDPAYAGKTGKALRINVNGSNANVATTHIAAGTIPAMTLVNNFTWAGWVRTRQTGGNNIIFGNRYNATGGENAPVQFIKLTPSNFEWYYNGVGEFNDYTDLVGTAAAPSPWTHFASVKTGNTLTLYINGVQALSRTLTLSQISHPFFVGGNRSGAGTTEGWSGLVDDVALWNKALPAQAVAGLYTGAYTPGTAPTTATILPPTVPVPPSEVAWPMTPNDLLTDGFDGPAIDTGKWTEVDQGLENAGAAGYSAAISGGTLVLSGTATQQYWYGKTLRSVSRFNARRRQELTVDRVALTRGGPVTNVVRSSVWLWADAGHYVHFSHNWNEGGWSYNSNDAGGSGTLNPTGGGNNLALADADDANGGSFEMKLVWIPGTYPGQGTVQMYKGGTLLGSQTVSNWPADFHVMLTGQARAVGDIVSATFDNVRVREFTENRLNTPLASAGGSAYYFRKAFTFAGDPSLTTGRLYPLVDDGAIFYLNGTEIHRQNLPGGAVTGATQASAEVTNGFLPATPIAIPSSALQAGANVLAVEVHGFNGASDPDMLFAAQVMLDESQSPPVDTVPSLVFQMLRSPADAVTNPVDTIVIRNLGATAMNLSGVEIRDGITPLYTFTSGTLATGASVAVPLASLPGYADGMELSLMAAGGGRQLDSRRVDAVSRLRYSSPGGVIEWATPAPHHTEIVINEIFYDGPGDSPEQWVELHNKSGAPVDVGNWEFSDGITFAIPPGTSIPGGGYLVVAWNTAAFTALHPGVANVLGPFDGEMDRDGERLRLTDANGNIADEVRFFPGERGSPLGVGGAWPKWAGGGGASLELTDPNADNSASSAWSDSAATPGAWQTINYTFSGANISGDPVQWNEVLFGLLDDGEAMVDDFHIIVDPGLGTQADLTQDATFEGTAIGAQPATWRLIGTHRHSAVAADPDNAGQKVLHVRASNAYEHMHNQCSTTLKSGGVVHTINTAKSYQITCRARWLRGSNQFHTRLYFNKGARTTLLPESPTGGTPGVQNSTYVLNAKPFTLTGATHEPAVPAASTPAVVTVKIVATTQTVTTATLNYTAIDGGAGSGSAVMSLVSGNTWSAQIPGQTTGRKFSYSFTVTGSGGANITAPGGLIQWNDGNALLTLPSGVSPTNIRIIMSDADRTFMHTAINVMSNDRLPCTIIENERDIYHNCGVRLKGSGRGRNQPVRVGFNLMFPPENLFRGTMEVVTIDRSGAGNEFSQKEMLVKHMISHAGGLPSMEDDLIRVIAPQAAQNGPAMMTRRYDGNWFNDQYSGTQDDGTMFEYELIYYPTSNSPAGNVENPKPPEPDNVVGVGVNSLGPNTENYRWHWLIKNRRELDNYASVIPVLAAVGQPSGASFNTAAAQQLEVDNWVRCFAAQILCGIGDGYSSGAQHNMLLYVPPAGSGLKAMYFPWDMDFSFNTGSTSSMTPSADLTKFLANPVWKRLYWGHVHDICTTSYNTTYLSPWAVHYSKFVNQDLTAFLSYISARNAHALSQVTANVPGVTFAITTATGGSPGANFSAPGPLVTLDGDGWVNVMHIRVNGGEPVAVTWLDDNSWRINLPVLFGPNPFLIEGLNSSGTVVGSDTITVTGTSATVAADSTNTTLSELMFNPPAGGAEFIELVNFSSSTVVFTNCYFSQGVTFNFAPGTQVLPGGRILIVQDQAAFAAAYPGFSGQIAAGAYGPDTALSNGGESLTLLAADGSPIFSVSYSDDIVSTDGGGRSLVRILASTNPDTGAYDWRESLSPGGSPGGSDSVAFTGTAGADVDGDGFSALAEYAFGTSDTNAASFPASPAWPIAGNTLTLTIIRRAGADDAIIEPFLSDNLAAWSLPAGWTGTGTVTTLAGGMESVAYPPLALPPTDPREFFRLTVRSR